MQTPHQSPSGLSRTMSCPNAPQRPSRMNWIEDTCVVTFLNHDNPSHEITTEAYYFRDINMNITLHGAYEFIIDKLQPHDDLKKILNEKYKKFDHRGLYDCLDLIHLFI